MQKVKSEPRDLIYLWVFFSQAKDAIQKLRQKELMNLNISPVEAIVLMLLGADNSGATQAELSRWLFREPQSVSGLLKRMECKKLVNIERERANRPRKKITLTPEGVKLRKKAIENKSIKTLLNSTFSNREAKIFGSYLMRLRNNALERINMKDTVLLPVPHLDIPAEFFHVSETT